MKKGLLYGLLLMLCAAPLHAATILVFGDSISAAYGLEVEQGWVRLLQQKLDKAAPGRHRVVNASLSGETTSGGKSRLPALLQKHHPDVLVLELGGNDGLRGQPPAMMEANLKAMIAMGREAGSRVVLLGMKIPPNYGRAYTQAFENVFTQLGKSGQVTLVPFFLEGIGGRTELMQADGIHPNARAQARLLENAWPAVEKALR